MNRLAFALTASAALCVAAPARADVSSFLAFGGGAGFEHSNAAGGSNQGAGLFTASIGVGTSPRKSFVFAGMFRSTTYFGLGTDAGIAARFASGGFARGQWGVAFDLGPEVRSFGAYGRYPIQGIFTLGMPYGFQVGVGAQALNLGGDPQPFGGFAVFELDILRLTVMRQGKTDQTWWNASPAGGHLNEPER
ncbi:MAG TPA: hypothetical protein VF407_19230 [Polyangiaceae bacterium]